MADWAKDAREGPRVLMSLRWRLLSLFLSSLCCHSSSKKQRNPLMKKILGLQAPMELTSCGSKSIFILFSFVNGEGSTPKDPLYKILDELRSLKLWKEKQERKEKGKKRVEEISQDEREKIREEERRKMRKEMKREKHASYSSHNSCKSLSEELRDYYEGRHRSHLRPHSHRRENERKPQEVNIKLPYFHGKDNVEAYLDWEIRVEQKLKRKPTLKSYGYHSYPKKDQGLGILAAAPSKPNDDKGKTIEKQPPKAKDTLLLNAPPRNLYSSQDEATTSPSSSESEEAKGEESSEEIYPQEEGKPLMVKEESKEVSVFSKRLTKKESHFEIKTNIKETSPLRQPPHFLLCKKTLVSIAIPLRLEFIHQVKELLDKDWARDPREGPRVLMNLRVDFNSFFHGLFPSGWHLLSPILLCLPLHLHGGKSPLKDLIEAQRSSLHRSPTSKLPSSGNQSTRASSSVNGKGTSHKDPLSRILDELSSLKLWKEKQERKEKGKKRVEEISQDERKKIREEERRKIMKEMKRDKHASYSSHNSCKILSEELRDYYEGRHRSHLRPHSHRREKERKPQEANIKLSYFHGKDNVEANLDWEIRVEQQLKKKSTSKSYGSHSYPKKDQGQGILGVTPSKPKDDKGKTIEKQAPKASMQEKTSSIKCFKRLGRGHITSQCPTTKTMIMRGQDIYSSQDEATTSPSSSESEKAKGEESSEEIYPQEEGQPLVVKEKFKELSSSFSSQGASSPSFLSKAHLGGEAPSSMAYSLVDGTSSHLFSFVFRCISMIEEAKEHHLDEDALIPHVVAPCGACRPWIFFINGFICFLRSDCSGMEKEKDEWRCNFK
ncbi:hypothetical protein HKD37_17G048353 [Glycine soja]